MKTDNFYPLKRFLSRWTLMLVLMLSFVLGAFAETKTSNASGNWSSPATWSPAGVPKDTDDVIIRGGHTVTVDSNYTCANLDVGNNNDNNTTLRITTAAGGLTITGNLRINPNNRSRTYIFDAGPGIINVNGTFSHFSGTGSNTIRVNTGTINFTPAVTINDNDQAIIFDGAGTINFLSHFTHNENKLTTVNGCNLNFYGNYNATDKNVDWKKLGTANFYGTGTVNTSANLKFHHINFMPGAATTFASGTGTTTITGALVISSGATFTANKGFELESNFTNNGTFTSGAVTVIMNGVNNTINGSSSPTFSTLSVGKTGGGTDVLLNIGVNTTVGNLVFSQANRNRQLNINSGRTLTVTGNATLNQSGKDNFHSWISVGNNTLNIQGNLIFSGTNNSTKRTCRVEVGAGSFTLDGNITWMSNSGVATEVISVASGTINFNSSINLGDKSGTIRVTSSGNLNFYGTSAPSFSFGGGTVPVFGTSGGSTVRFSNGLTFSKPLTFAAGCNVKFLGSATFTPTTSTVLPHVEIEPGVTLTAGGNFNVRGNWINQGTFVPNGHTVSFTGSGTQNISKTGGTETFHGLAATSATSTVVLQGDVIVTGSLNLGGGKINLNGNTLTLGNGSGAALTRTAGQIYGGTLKRWWPTGGITATSGNYYGLFPVGTHNSYRPVSITSTANPTTAGYVSVVHEHKIGVIPVTYVDNGGSNIEAVTEMNTVVSTTGLVGGTYNIDVRFGGLGSAGHVSNLKLVTCTTDTIMGSVGTHAITAGTVDAPIGKRTGVSATNLNQRWVIGTNDKNATPLYRYVYSRKSGNWGDASGTGTWSYTPGGSGAACSCLPGSSGYAVIYSGHVVNVFSSDSAAFVDVLDGGTLDVKNPRTLNVMGNLTLEGSATLNTNGTLRVHGELTLSSSTSVTGDIVVLGQITVPSGTELELTSGSMVLSGEVSVDGILKVGSGVSLSMNGSGSEIFGTGSILTASGGTVNITNHKTIREGSSLSFGSPSITTHVSIGSEAVVNNMGEVTVYGNITGGNANSTWFNNAFSKLNATGTVLSTGILDVETEPNIVNYSGSGAQTIKVPYSAYNILMASNAGTKTIAGETQVDSLLYITDAAIVNEGSNIIWGPGGIKMEGTAQLRLDRSTDEYVSPELSGDYDLISGDVIINQTGDSAVVAPAEYYNLVLNGTHAYDLSGVTRVKNNLNISNTAFLNSTGYLTVDGNVNYTSSGTTIITDSITIGGLNLSAGTFNADEYIINIKGIGGFNRTGGTFVPGTGVLEFSGTDNQHMTSNTTSFNLNHLRMNKIGGDFSVTGSINSLYITGDVDLLKGHFDGTISTVDTIRMLAGNWRNDSATFTPGDIIIMFLNDTAAQAISGSAATQTLHTLVMTKGGSQLSLNGQLQNLNINGNMVLNTGTFNKGGAYTINVGGNWTKNSGAAFSPSSGEVVFAGSGNQSINGTATSHDFSDFVVDKMGGKLDVGGSATSIYITGDVVLNMGEFDKGTAANIYVAGDWTNHGSTFTHGTGTVHFNGSNQQNINGSVNAHSFHHFVVNNGAATLAFNNDDTLNIAGNLTFTSGRLFAGNNTFFNLSGGNWVNNGGTFLPSTGTVCFSNAAANQSITGTGATQSFNTMMMNKPGRHLDVAGNITSISISGDYILSAGTFDNGTATNIAVGGNWVNHAAFNSGSGTVTFNGNAAQGISGDSITTFNGLTINKSADALTLGTPAHVNGALTLTNGVVNTTLTNLLTLGAAATSTSGSATSHISGPMKKVGNTDFVFPVGKGGKWRRAGVSEITSPTTEMLCEYFDQPYVNTTTFLAPLDAVGLHEYWNISREVTSDAVKIRLYWEDASTSGIQNCDYLTIAHWTGSRWEEEPATADGGSVCSGTGAGSITTTGVVGSFSPFGFGGTGGGGALPVKLTELKAIPLESFIRVQWTTATEINNKGFEVQRSTDGERFATIGWVDGNGFSTSEINYSFDDKEVAANVVYYYRLKQVDYDETTEYSKLVSASLGSSKIGEIIWSKLMPNPTASKTNLVINSATEGDVEVRLLNLMGQEMFHSKDQLRKGLYSLEVDVERLQSGYYITEIYINNQKHTLRLLRE